MADPLRVDNGQTWTELVREMDSARWPEEFFP